MTVMANQITSMQMNQNVMQALKGSSSVMAAVNKEMNPAEMAGVMKDFAKEMDKAGVQMDMVGDAFEMMEDPSANADADDVYEGILGELNLEFQAGQAAVPKGALPQAAAAEEVKEDNSEMEARLAALKMA